MNNFYQFSSIINRILWQKSFNDNKRIDKKFKKNNKKTLWKNFTFVIILIEQMRQKIDFMFQNFWNRTKTNDFNKTNVKLLNNQIAIEFFFLNFLNNIVVVQRNELKHIINRLQIERFAQMHNKFFFFNDSFSHSQKWKKKFYAQKFFQLLK